VGASQKPFYALQQDLDWFMRCSELRVLHVATGGDERPIVLQQVALAEGHPRNRSPFFVLEDAHSKVDDGWTMRAARMREIHAARREAMARQGYRLPILAEAKEADTPLALFARQVFQCIEAQSSVPELTGLTLILAPGRLDAPKVFVESIARLADEKALGDVRFVIVELGDGLRAPLARRFQSALMESRCFRDRDAERQEFGALLDAASGAPEGASPQVQAGGAGPRDVLAPPRAGKPPRDAPLPPEVAATLSAQLGPAAALLGRAGFLLRQRVLGAASALQGGRVDDALRIQGEARDQCYAAGMEQLGILLEIIRASYLALGARRKPARAAYEAAAERATASGHSELAAQAFLGAGNLAALDKDWVNATRFANRAGQAGERGAQPALAIEGYRCAGQFALRGGSDKVAIDRWKLAMEIAKAAPGDTASLSGAPVVARALAKVLHDKGAHASAAALLLEAEEIERAKGAEPRRKRKKKSRAPKVTANGTEVMTRPLRPKGPTDTEIAERVRPERKSVTPTGTEVLAEPLAPKGDDDVRG
jgi:hypothetical protein